MPRYIAALLGASALCAPHMAAAQERPPSSYAPNTNTGWSINVGAGALYSPKYLGDDAYALSAVPYIRITHSDRFFASVQEGAGYALIQKDGFRAGPLLGLDFGRDEDGSGVFQISGDDTTDLLGLSDIDTTVSIGGFAEMDLGPLTASARVGQALGGHDGLTGDVGLSVKGRYQNSGPPIIYSFGPRINFGDRDYMQAFFGVDAAQSARSGLPVYNSAGGIVSYGVSATAIMPLTRKVSATVLANYNRLSGDAAKAPLVAQRGSKDQAFAGLVLAYKFK